MPRLVIYPRTPLARELQLKPGENLIGRAFANDLRLEDASVSGSHCQIIVNGGSATIRDLGSTNGTFLERVQIREAALLPGQTLHLGGVEVLFKADSGTQPIGRVSSGVASSIPSSPPRNGAPITATSSAFAPIGQLASVPGVPPLSAAATASATAPTAFLSRADIPPPRPSPGLRPAALAPEPPQPADVAASPAPGPVVSTGQVFEAPPGKTACKFHPKTGGNWLCQKCTELYCSLCVSPRPMGKETGFFCRKCGTQCVPVKPNFVAPKEKVITEYSDAAVLMRSIGFGAGAAVGVAVIWILLALIPFQAPYVECWIMGAACGYAVKVGCQDRPSIVFSLIAVFSSIFGILVAMVGSTLASGTLVLGGLIYLVVGILGAMFTAWRIGGGDF
jgi:hypothetical protein